MSIWSKRREDEQTPAPKPYSALARPASAAPAPGAVESKKEAPLSAPTGKLDSDFRAGSAAIGKAVRIVGQIYSKEDLYIDGDVEGTIEVLEHKLTIGPNGRVQSGIKAREVVVLGSIQGNVEATDRVEIRKDARLIGDLRTAR